MKCSLLFVFTLVLFVSCNEDNDFLAKMTNSIPDCVNESGVEPELVDKLLDKSEFIEDQKLKCFISCVYTKTEAMSKDGTFNVDILKKTLEDDQSPDIVDKCKDVKGNDNCETAFLVAKCLDGK